MRNLKFPLVTDHLLLQPGDEQNLWNETWTVRLKDAPQETIGTFTLAGAKIAGEVPIRVELEPAYRNQGYGTEIFYFVSRFVFRFRNLKEISAVCAHVNDSCVHALDKAGYVFRENKDGMDYYSMKRSKSAWAGLYLFIGLFAGLILGLAISNLWIGTAIGIFAGLLIGFLLDQREKKG